MLKIKQCIKIYIQYFSYKNDSMTNHRKIEEEEEEEEKQYKIANKMAPTMISYRG